MSPSQQATFDSSKWNKEAGKDEQLSFGKDGLLMKLTEEDANIVFESNAKQVTFPLLLHLLGS